MNAPTPAEQLLPRPDPRKAAFEANVDVVRAEGSDRAAIVSRAMEKLKSGELDTEAVYRDAASRLLATDFRTA